MFYTSNKTLLCGYTSRFRIRFYCLNSGFFIITEMGLDSKHIESRPAKHSFEFQQRVKFTRTWAGTLLGAKKKKTSKLNFLCHLNRSELFVLGFEWKQNSFEIEQILLLASTLLVFVTPLLYFYVCEYFCRRSHSLFLPSPLFPSPTSRVHSNIKTGLHTQISKNKIIVSTYFHSKSKLLHYFPRFCSHSNFSNKSDSRDPFFEQASLPSKKRENLSYD